MSNRPRAVEVHRSLGEAPVHQQLRDFHEEPTALALQAIVLDLKHRNLHSFVWAEGLVNLLVKMEAEIEDLKGQLRARKPD